MPLGMISVWPGETGDPSRIAIARPLAMTMRSSGSAQNGQGLGVAIVRAGDRKAVNGER